MESLGWVDALMLSVVGLSMLMGLWRGFLYEIMALAGWLVAFLVAQACAGLLEPLLPVGDEGSGLRFGAAWFLCFIAALLAWTLLAMLVRRIVHFTPLRWPDRAVGAVFGLLRGVLLLMIAVFLVGMTPLARADDWQTSTGRAWLERTIEGVRPFLPSQIPGFKGA